MTRNLAAFLLMFIAASACWAQDLNTGDACSHVSGGCPTFSHHDTSSGSGLFTCDADCQERRQEARKEKEAADERHRTAKFDAKMQRDHARAQRLADEAFDHYEKKDCRKAVELYDKALALWEGPHNNYDNPWAWDENMGASLICFSQNLPADGAERLRYEKLAYDYYYRSLHQYNADPGEIKRMKWAMWTLEYNHGRRCPEPPDWDGDSRGCVGRDDMKHDAYPYVPLPVVTAENWSLRNLFVTRNSAFSAQNEHWHIYDDSALRSLKDILNWEMTVEGDNAARFTLPDGHDFVLDEDSDLQLQDFVYDPNESLTSFAIEKLQGMLRMVSGKFQWNKEQKIRVQMPHGTLAMRGTDVEIEHGQDGRWIVYVLSGLAFFAKPGQSLNDPETLEIDARDPHNGACIADAEAETNNTYHGQCAIVIETDGRVHKMRLIHPEGEAEGIFYAHSAYTDDWTMWTQYGRDWQ